VISSFVIDCRGKNNIRCLVSLSLIPRPIIPPCSPLPTSTPTISRGEERAVLLHAVAATASQISSPPTLVSTCPRPIPPPPPPRHFAGRSRSHVLPAYPICILRYVLSALPALPVLLHPPHNFSPRLPTACVSWSCVVSPSYRARPRLRKLHRYDRAINQARTPRKGRKAPSACPQELR